MLENLARGITMRRNQLHQMATVALPEFMKFFPDQRVIHVTIRLPRAFT